MRSLCLPCVAIMAFAAPLAWSQPSAINVPADKGCLLLSVPLSSEVKINGQLTKETGSLRLFFTPTLAPGKYTYEIAVHWTEGGKELQATRKVEIEPGRFLNVVFTAKDATVTGNAPPAKAEAKVEAKVEAKPKVNKLPDIEPEAKSRKFEFVYAGKVTGLEPGKLAKVWLPAATSNDLQVASIVKVEAPADVQTNKEPQYGNTILYFEAKANEKGEVPFQVTYHVARVEAKTEPSRLKLLKAGESKDLIKRFLSADAKVPLEGKPLSLIKDKKLPGDPVGAAKTLYDVVYDHMEYKKTGEGWGQGDAVWACDSKYGNCTDFHSLFISLTRANKIPTKFEMGFPIPDQRGQGAVGGYHCWAWFMPNEAGWVPVDISEAKIKGARDYYFGNLTENRVQFTTGRDLELVPKQAGGPVNFLIYPYVEVDGVVYDKNKVERSFSYRDI